MIPEHSVTLMAEDGSRLGSWLVQDDEDLQDLKQYGRRFKRAKTLKVTTANPKCRCTKEYRKNAHGDWC